MLLSTYTMFPSASAVTLALLLAFGLLTLWHPARWPLSLFQAGIFLLAALWGARLIRSPFPPRTGFPALPLAAATLWAALHLAFGWTVYRFPTWEALLYWSVATLLYLLARQLFDDHPLRRRFLRALVFFAFALSVLASLQYFSSQGRVFWIFPMPYATPLATFQYRNDYSAFIELLFPVALYEALKDRRRALLFTAIAGVMYASVIAGASRAGSVLVSLEILLILLLARRAFPERGVRSTLSRAALFAAIFTAVVGWQIVWGRFFQPDPYVGRRELLLSSIAMVRDRPLTGFGLGAWPTAYPAYALVDTGQFANHAHNDWAEWAAEGGLPLFLLMLSLALWSLRPALRSVWGLGVPIFFLHCFVDYPTRRLPLAACLFILLAALAASRSAPLFPRTETWYDCKCAPDGGAHEPAT
jgi:O-antigen ligase